MNIEIFIEIETEVELLKAHENEKEKHRNRRKTKIKNKGREKVKTLSYQKTVDAFKKGYKKKNVSLKEKGKICKGGVACNGKCEKSWRHLGCKYGVAPYTGNYKFSAIWTIT